MDVVEEKNRDGEEVAGEEKINDSSAIQIDDVSRTSISSQRKNQEQKKIVEESDEEGDASHGEGNGDVMIAFVLASWSSDLDRRSISDSHR